MNATASSRNCLPPQYPDGGVDSVNLGDCRAFMRTSDKLYRGCIATTHRASQVDPDYASKADQNKQPSAVPRATIATVTDARYGIYLILHHLIENGIKPTFIDTEARCGQMGIRYGNFFRTLGFKGKAYCLESADTAELIPFNITLNGAESHVEYKPQPTSLCDFLRDAGVESAFIKLTSDTALTELETFLTETPSVVSFEIHSNKKESLQTLSHLLKTHVLFDVGFIHRPFCFSPVTDRDVKQFLRIVANYPHRATHMIALSKTIPEIHELAYRLACLMPGAVEYSLVMEPHTPPHGRTMSRLANQVEVIVVNNPATSGVPLESPFSPDMPAGTLQLTGTGAFRPPIS